jgi:DNA polymerase III subunit epsilon
MREIALDTETTGFEPHEGHRIVEIGCVEMIGRVRTGRSFHCYLNPERSMPEGAFQVHGLSSSFLSDKPKFSEVAEKFLAFMGDTPMVIHNADFDIKFVNAELKKVGLPLFPNDRAFCTLKYARKKFPGSPASLDALCKRFNIDLSSRTRHGALLDAELLADMYLELMGGAQEALNLAAETVAAAEKTEEIQTVARVLEARAHGASEEEKVRHKEFLGKIKNPLWQEAE